MLRNKKGGVSSILTTFYAYILLILIITVFYLLFNVTGKISVMTITSGNSDYINTNTQLLGILRSPVEIDNTQLTIADIIILAQKEQCKTIEDATKEKPFCQALYSNLTNKGKISIEDGLNFGSGCAINKASVIKLPYEGKQISVTLCAE